MHRPRKYDGKNSELTRKVHNESLHCTWGLISRLGWVAYDDSQNWCLTPEYWWDTPNNDLIDIYFFGHGLNYSAALADFVQVSGRTAMTPRYAAGIWWSRWYDYNDYDVQQVVEDYQVNCSNS